MLALAANLGPLAKILLKIPRKKNDHISQNVSLERSAVCLPHHSKFTTKDTTF